jgi:rubrerythrin
MGKYEPPAGNPVYRHMTRELSAFEVLQIAEQMEREAAKFYRRAAEMYNDPSISKLFSGLAQWEEGHLQVFADMREHFSEQAWERGRFSPDRIGVSRLGVPPAVFSERSEPTKELTGNETRAEVLRLALQKERYTLGYYTALTELALGPDNIKVIRSILQEEGKHVRILDQALGQNADY